MPVTRSAVSAYEVTFRYKGRVALDRSSFEIPAGAVTAIIGPNGSGKSTLLNAIAGLIEPAGGELVVHPVNGHKAKVSYVLQSTKVNESLPVTVSEVVTMGRYAGKGAFRWMRGEDRREVGEAMDRMDITELANRHLPELSGGQRQRVFVAQGLAQDHDILLLDEPVTGLDVPSAQAIDEVIHGELERGCSVIMSTHDVSEAQVADHVLLLAGRVVAAGDPAEVLTIEYLTAAYGPSLLHVDGDKLFIDDPHHRPAAARHAHRERTIHVEVSETELHGED